jgi:hypothetical protein
VTLREALGSDARRVHELVEQLLDSEDSLIMLVDGRRAVGYGAGFGLSACQLELMTSDIERAVRTLATTRTSRKEDRTRHEEDHG